MRSNQIPESVALFVEGLDFCVADPERPNIVSSGGMSFEIVAGPPNRIQCVVFSERRDILVAKMIVAGWKQITEGILESPIDGTQIKIEE